MKAARCLLWLAALSWLAACTGLQEALPAARPSPPAQAPLASPTLAFVPSPTPLASATPINPDTGWLTLRQGLEQRVLNLLAEDGELLEHMVILRLDPAHYRFDVAYRPGEPLSLARWQEETGALLVVNGGFFTEEQLATGLLIADGQTYGASYEGFGGMFAVTAEGPSLRWLAQQPYTPGEPMQAALQAFPMLLTPGGAPGPSSDDGQRARRTVAAQDSAGRVLFMVAARGHFTLYQLSRYLQASDLELDTALNLDGGASSGLLLAEPAIFVPALSSLPAIIVVYEK